MLTKKELINILIDELKDVSGLVRKNSKDIYESNKRETFKKMCQSKAAFGGHIRIEDSKNKNDKDKLVDLGINSKGMVMAEVNWL